VLELNSGLEFHPIREAEFFPFLPAKPGVCLIEPRERNAEPYLIRTADLQGRLQRLLGRTDPASKRLNLREFARGVRYRETGSAFEQSLTYYHNAKKYFPKRYRDMMRLRPPAVLKVNLQNAYPRCYVTRRIAVDDHGMPTGGTYYGPFASRRSAEAFSDKFLDFFRVRRCQIKIRRDPTFPGCLYSEMKMCLAPCFAGCTKEEYDAEVQRLVEFLETNSGSLRSAFQQEREKASEGLDFERAAMIHKKLEKLDDVLRGRPELVRRIPGLDSVILQRTTEEQAIGLYGVRGGRLAEPFTLRFGDTSEPQSAEEAVHEYLEGVMSAPLPKVTNATQNSADLTDHLWLVARWFYSQPRDGEIFFREKDWPYRRILRGCSRLLAPKKKETLKQGTANGEKKGQEPK
jgi:excinuclease ABC subunit C